MARSNGGDEEQQRGVAAAATRSGGGELLRRICGEGPSRDKSFGPRKPGRETADLIGSLPLVTINRLVSTGRCNGSGTPHRPAPPPVRVRALPDLALIPRDGRAAQIEKKVAAAARQAYQVCAPHVYTRPRARGHCMM